MMSERVQGLLLGLGAAMLFGASAPAVKLLLPGTGILALTALLYLGAGIAVTVARLTLRVATKAGGASPEAALRKPDLPSLAGIVVLGGAVAPALMVFGLAHTSGVTGALLLNLEAPFTIGLAVTLFGEHLTRLELGAAGCTMAGALALSVVPGPWSAEPLGVLPLAGACLCWAVDNNLSQRLSAKDPFQIVQVKTLGAGIGTALLALLLGQSWPTPGRVVGALGLGALSYGVSLVLDMRALRLLGAAREAAVFSLAPFMGAVLSIPLLGERPVGLQAVAAALMAAGVWLLFRARHAHAHTHEALAHEHLHTHDEHHRHPHPEGTPPEPHSHPHQHRSLTHAHPHVSDAHHRHKHH